MLRDAHLAIREKIGPPLLQTNCLFLISRQRDKLDIGLLAQELDRGLEEFVTLGIMIVSFTRRRTESHHQILLLKSELRPDTRIRNKSRNIDVYLNPRGFYDSVRLVSAAGLGNRFR